MAKEAFDKIKAGLAEAVLSTNMVERVAVALAKTNGGDFYDPAYYTEDQRNVWRTKARDGIAAMREPTEGMLKAVPVPWGGQGVHVPEPSDKEVWQAMIDAALK